MLGKKGMVILLMASIAFLVTSIYFFQYKTDDYLGKPEIELLEVAKEGENMLTYFDISVRRAFDDAIEVKPKRGPYENEISIRNVCEIDTRICKENYLEEAYRTKLVEYLKRFNQKYKQKLEAEDFIVDIKFLKNKIIVTGTTDERIELKGEGYSYRLNPSFRFETIL